MDRRVGSYEHVDDLPNSCLSFVPRPAANVVSWLMLHGALDPGGFRGSTIRRAIDVMLSGIAA
jgi:hypothetical protein